MNPSEPLPQNQAGLPGIVRREQTERELKRLKASIESWFELRYDRDRDELGKYAGLHKTRLDTLKQILDSALERLNQNLRQLDISPGRATPIIYSECRRADQALVWLERVWRYYQEKFDQRDQEQLAPILQSADEVVWSCYHQTFLRSDRLPEGWVKKPAPLAYLAPEYSPATWERGKLAPSELQRDGPAMGLEELVRRLPVPVLRLPPWCVEAPWWLVFVAHEVGHNVHFDLNLVEAFSRRLVEIAQNVGFSREEQKQWSYWGLEIFPDLFSVILMGKWAIRALVELELTTPDLMVLPRVRENPTRDPAYPAPVVRLELMVRAAERLGVETAEVLGGLDLSAFARGNPEISRALTLVNPVLDYVFGTIAENPANLGLPSLLGFDQTALQAFGETGIVRTWARHLKQRPPNPTQSLGMPRYLTCAAVAAWLEVTKMTEPAGRQQAFETLKKNTLDTLRNSGPPGERARAQPARDLKTVGASLTDQALTLSEGLLANPT